MRGPRHSYGSNRAGGERAPRILAEFTLASEPGNERQAMARVAEVVRELGLPPAVLARLGTAVAEATMNAIEHGNQLRPELPVTVRVLASAEGVFVLISDRGGGPIPQPSSEVPNLEAKVKGLEAPCGWGLFLIQHMVDEMNVTSGVAYHTVELVLHLKGGSDACETV